MDAQEASEKPAARRTGRWRTGQESRRRILRAARALFVADGYERATVRAIAAEAGVDVAMVYYFFGSKEKLFAEVLAAAEHPLRLLEPLLDEGLDDVGRRLVRRCLERWDSDDFQPALALFRSAVEQRSAKDLIRESAQGPIAGRLTREFGIADPDIRLELATVHLMGLATARYQLGMPVLALADLETLVAWIGPTIQRYLTGPSPTPP